MTITGHLARLNRSVPAPAALAIGLLGVAAATALGRALSGDLDAAAAAVLYQPVVLAVSGLFGLWQGLAVSVASAAAYNWFFIPPLYTLDVAQASGVLTLTVFTLTAVVTSHLAAGFRAQREASDARRRDADLLRALAECALTNAGLGPPGPAVEQAAARALGVRDCRIVVDDDAIPPGAGRVAPSPAGFTIPLSVHGTPRGALVLGPSNDDADPGWRRGETRDAVAGLAAVSVDRGRLLTAALETETLRRSDELKTALLHGMSHELRTPLTAIAAAAHTVSGGSGDARTLGALIEDQSRRLEQLISNLLDLSRLEADAVRARLDWCAPEEMVTGAVAAAGVESVTVALPPDLPLVRADAVLCERILVNFLLNAARHGAPPIMVEGATDDGRLALTVRDAGPGPDRDIAGREFTPFVAGAVSGGSGVGLALARGFATAQGGAVDLVADSRGTAATLRLPLSPPPAMAP